MTLDVQDGKKRSKTMNREEAKQWFINPDYKMLRETKITSVFYGKSQEQAIDKVFDAHEAQLKAKDDKYHELKDLFNSLDEQHDLLKLKNIELVERGNRTCEGCKHYEEENVYIENSGLCHEYVGLGYAINNTVHSDFSCNKWEKKDV